MMRLLVTSLLIVGSLIAVPVVAAAQPGRVEEELDGAKALYRDGRLEEAIGALRTVIVKLNELQDIDNGTQQLADAHFHLGLAYLAMRDESAALESFRQVAALDPDRVLETEIYSPKVVSLFERARADVVRTVTPQALPPDEGGAPRAATGVAPLARGDALLRILPGTKLRAERSGGRLAVEGQLIAIDDRVVTLGGDDWRVDIPHEDLIRVHVVTHRRNHWIAGMLIGGGLGALIGAFEVPGCGGNDGDCYTRGENMGYGGLGFGLVGALIGALYKTDQWAEVPLARAASRGIAQPSVAFSLSW